jgi:hypothetical protein
MFLSPVTPVAHLFGVVAAFKLLLLPTFVFGCLGMWALAGQLGLTGRSRWVPALVFFGSSIYPLYLSGGLPNWMFGMALLPWLFLCHRRAGEDHRFVFLAGLLYAGLLFCGSIYHFVFFPVLLILDALCLAIWRRNVKPLITLASALLVGLALAAVRVVPLLEVYNQFPRELGAGGRHLTPLLALRALLDSTLPDLNTRLGGLMPSGAYWINFGSYIGPVSMTLAALGLISRARESRIPAVLALIFFWLSLGAAVQPSLWSGLHLLPFFGSMHAPARMAFFVAFSLALLAGYGHRVAEEWMAARPNWSPTFRHLAGLGILVLAVIPMMLVNAPISRTAFIVSPPRDVTDSGWFQVRQERPPFRQLLVPNHPSQFGGPLYEGVLRNAGNVLGQSDIPAGYAVHHKGSPAYRGEAYLQGGAGEVEAEITPNIIRVRARVSARDLLVINQNFFPGWWSEGTVSGPMEPLLQRVPSQNRFKRYGHGYAPEAVLSIALPPGSHELTLRYRPTGPRVGLAISLLAAAVALTYLRFSSGLGTPSQRFGTLETLTLVAYAVLAGGVGLFLL